MLALLGGGYKIYDFHQKNKHLDGLVAQSLAEQDRLKATNDSIAKAVVAKNEVITDMQTQISNLKCICRSHIVNHQTQELRALTMAH